MKEEVIDHYPIFLYEAFYAMTFHATSGSLHIKWKVDDGYQ